jgi:nucleotide-binding universal stress UspA family protein
LCGCDDNDYSDYALQWLIDELVDDGDEIVCLRVIDKDTVSEKHLESGRYRDEAEALMKQFQAKNHENKAINLILEFSVGKVNKVIDEMVSTHFSTLSRLAVTLTTGQINLYEPAILVVGTRGRNLGGFQGLLPGSVSKYCLQSSPVPVIVVLPSSKRDKSRVKRAQDPSRQEYKNLLEKSGSQGGYNLSASNRNSFIAPEDTQNASTEESNAVADAVGYKRLVETSPLAQVQTPPEQGDDTTATMQEEQDVGNLLKSPTLQNLDSPETSDASSSDGEGSIGVSAVDRRTKASEKGDPAAR